MPVKMYLYLVDLASENGVLFATSIGAKIIFIFQDSGDHSVYQSSKDNTTQEDRSAGFENSNYF